MPKESARRGRTWLLLVHQLPPRPTRLRVRVWRRLQRLGAVAVKNSVWALPAGAQAGEDFAWLEQEIGAAGGEAAVFRSTAVSRTTDAEIVAAFRRERDQAYAALAAELEALRRALADGGPRPAAADLAAAAADLERLAGELRRIAAGGDFGARGRAAAAAALARSRAALRRAQGRRDRPARRRVGVLDARDFQGKRWVTRPRPHIDRLASAWLIDRFIDRRARFVFAAEAAVPAGAIPFDMAGVEFGHHGEDCTFETLVARFGLRGHRGLRALGEIVHDLDLKDGKFQRPEVAGVEALVAGLAARLTDDRALVRAARPLLDALFAALAARRRRA